MASGDNESGPAIFPGGVEIGVPDLTVTRPAGTLVNNTESSKPGLYTSDGTDYTYVGGAAAQLWPGVPEMESLVFTANPADGETYTLQVGTSTEVYTFRTVPSLTNDVEIGASAADTQENLAVKIDAIQGSSSPSYVVDAVNYADPLLLIGMNSDDLITQTDGTGGDIDIRTSNSWGQQRQPEQQVSFFHIRQQINADTVADGIVYIALPVGYQVQIRSGLILDGSGGKGGDSLQVKAGFDGKFGLTFFTSGAPPVIVIEQGTVTTFANADIAVVWGFLVPA